MFVVVAVEPEFGAVISAVIVEVIFEPGVAVVPRGPSKDIRCQHAIPFFSLEQRLLPVVVALAV